MSKDLERLFLKMLEQNQQKLFRICSVYSKNTEDSKDLFQEVLINIWKSLPSFEYKSTIETWVYRIALNTCLRFRSNQIKKQNRFVFMENMNSVKTQTEIENKEQKDNLLQLRSCISILNKSDKAIITLYLEMLPYKEISSITGLSENNIAVKIRRIKRKLLNCINETL